MAAIDTGRIEAAVAEILAAIGEDAGRPGLVSTPRRVAEAYTEFFGGVGIDPASHLTESKDFAVGEGERSELVVMRDLEFRSMCEHHLLPFVGVAHIAYLPGKRIVGLGAIPRVVDTLAARPQMQERLTEEIADVLEHSLHPDGVLVVIEANHGCVSARGPRQAKSTTVTMATRGTLTDAAARAEVITLIGVAEGARDPGGA